MAKQFKKFNVKKHTGFYKQNGEEKKEIRQVGEIILFSENTIPDDISIMINMYSESSPTGNPLSVYKNEPRQQTGSNQQSNNDQNNSNQGINFNR